jgi:Protein of unknown function (DUF3124)
MLWNRLLSLGLLATMLSDCHYISPEPTPRPKPRELKNVNPSPVSSPGMKRGSNGNKVYVPCYSHIRVADGQEYNLAINLGIRNTSQSEKMTVTLVDFYDSKGVLVKHYAAENIVLEPLETADFYLSEKEAAGGIGANFIVEWEKSPSLSKPIIEAVMVGTAGGQGISFVSKGELIP